MTKEEKRETFSLRLKTSIWAKARKKCIDNRKNFSVYMEELIEKDIKEKGSN